MRRIGLAFLLIATGLVWGTAPAGAGAQRATTGAVRPGIAAGTFFSCAVLANGTAQCWGQNNQGELGNGTATDSSTPVAVSGLANVDAIAAGSAHSCAVLANGTARCWGASGNGRVGNGSTAGSPMPVA